MNENQDLSVGTGGALEDLNSSYMLFYIDSALYGIPLTLVREIINIHSVTFTYLPNIAEYIRGIVNLRSKVVPVIDVRRKFHMAEREFDDKTCIIVLEIKEMSVGLIVDSVSEVVTLEEEQQTPPPKGGDAASRYLSSVAEADGRVILNIDCDKFFHSDLT